MEDSAYELLKSYLENLKLHFGREEGGEEIVSDIEDRIAEVFQDRLKKGAHCITDQDVHQMIDTMGRPEQLDEETATEPQAKPGAAGPEKEQPASSPKKLLRDENDKILGGVCSGLAAFLGIDPVIVRIITFLLIWAWGFGLLIYIVLWLALPSSQSLGNPVHKRLYRNPDNKVIGGVASGIAAYLHIDPVLPRIVFVLPLLGIIFTSIFHHWLWIPGFFFPLSVGSLPTLFVLYIILWISVPLAKSVTEKLEMRGEKVDIQSIANAMKGSSDEKKNEVSTPSAPAARTPAAPVIPEVSPEAERQEPVAVPYSQPSSSGSGLGRFIILLFKIFAYIIIGIIVFALCVALVGVAGGFIGTSAASSLMLPYKDLLLSGGFQRMLAWPAVLLTLGIPVVGILWLLLKLFTGFRPKTRAVGISLFVLWLAGVVCAVCVTVSVVKDFRMRYQESSHLTITQPHAGGILISHPVEDVSIGGWDVLNDFVEIGDDSVVLKTVSLALFKSRDDSFHIDLIRSSRGRSVSQARTFAESIVSQISQEDSVVYVPKGFALSAHEPFRSQHLILRVFIPVGKRVTVDESLRGLRRYDRWSDDWQDDDLENHAEDWDYGHPYLMTPNGLKQLDAEPDQETPGPPEEATPDTSLHKQKKGKIYHYRQV